MVIILNMFNDVIQESFDVMEDEKRIHQVNAFLQVRVIRYRVTDMLFLPASPLLFFGFW
jgi:hypothetical protein